MVEKDIEKKDMPEKDEKKEEIKAKIEEGKDKVEKRKTTAEKMFEDILSNVKEMQQEVEKRVSDYANSIPAKPNMDVIETEESIIIKTDLPGVSKDNININLTEDTIDIQAKFDNGILTVELPKVEKAEKFKVNID